MQTSLLMQLLQAMENPWIVATCVLVMIGIRYLWVRLLRATSTAEPVTNGRSTRALASVPPVPAKPKKKDTVLEVIDTVIIALILVFGIVRPFLLQTFFIPSESMVPTLKIDDKLIANKFIYMLRPPVHDEVVVFSPPTQALEGSYIDFVLRKWTVDHPGELSAKEWSQVILALQIWPAGHVNMSQQQLGQLVEMSQQDPGQVESWITNVMPTVSERHDDFIKRVIGVRGDHIRFRDGQVYRNGALLHESYLPDQHISFFPRDIPTVPPKPFRHLYFTLAGQPMMSRDFGTDFLNYINVWYMYYYCYKQNVDSGVLRNLNGDVEYIVPKGKVMVMGDNRMNSFDSRFWGMEPIKDVKARAIATFWPWTKHRLKLL